MYVLDNTLCTNFIKIVLNFQWHSNYSAIYVESIIVVFYGNEVIEINNFIVI